MIVPERIAQFIQGPAVIMVSTRNEKLRPCMSRGFGAYVNADRASVTIFLPTGPADDMLADMRRTLAVAVTFADGISHEGYQLKGRYRDHRPGSPAEEARQEAYIAALITRYKPYRPETFWGGFQYRPFSAVAFEIDAIFDQAPGPKAGSPIA
ncbi:MAG: pyridoxamine 5'-phosphate oxidase family protein [Candidatus Lambdaproteobacteria bacterium]|nr:pyridoxamine 5'-phosphate oxidase family protein [Candidatus Lambdaproteobacteria bacterium]